jgi:hypothetical protein
LRRQRKHSVGTALRAVAHPYKLNRPVVRVPIAFNVNIKSLNTLDNFHHNCHLQPDLQPRFRQVDPARPLSVATCLFGRG